MDDQKLYLEADEDITSAIDKLKAAPAGPVQIVVPKRSTLLQSVINLKLLKKAAEDSRHELVLVTTDKVASDLAGRLGLAVATAVGAKAVVAEATEAPLAAAAAEEVIEDDTPPPAEKPAKPTKEAKPAKAEKSEKAAAAAPIAARELADDEPETPAEAAEPAKGKKAKVPNYNKFQKRIIIGLVIAGVIIAYFVGMYFLTTAKVTLFIQAQPVNVSTSFAVATTGNTSPATGVLGGQTIQATKTVTSTFQATGSQDNGTKASGNLTVKNCSSSTPTTIPTGTTFISSGLDFTSTSTATIPQGTFNGGGCSAPGVGTVPVTAAANGGQYNLSNASFTSPGLDSHYTITTAQLSGGTSNIVKVVSASDVSTAQTAALSSDQSAEEKDLASKTPAGYLALTSSFTQTASNVASNPPVGQQATSATLTMQVAYTEVAVSQADLKTYVRAVEQQQLGVNSQIYDDGLAGAQITATGKTSAGLPQFKLVTTAYGGPKIDTTALAKQLAGKRIGDATVLTSQLPGVTQSQITLTPPWATSLPHIPGHITIKLSVANAK